MNTPTSITITPVHVGDLRVEGEEMPIYVHVIDHPQARVLVDTGLTQLHPAVADLGPRIRPLNEQQDFDLGSIDIVVNTHLHFDHCGGNHLFAGKPIYVQRQELEDARHVNDYTITEWVDPPGVNYVPVDGELELLPGIRLLPAPGHTRGTQIVVVEQGEHPVVIAGDAAVWHGELDDPSTEGQRRIRGLEPEAVWMTHAHEPWRPERHEPDPPEPAGGAEHPVIYSMGMSLDGYIVGPDGTFEWSVPDPAVFQFHIEALRQTGAHLLGRKLYETMLYWETPEGELDDHELEWAAMWRALPKVVFSTTITEVKGTNTRLAEGGLAEEIGRLRAETDVGGIAIGGATLAAAAAALDLIDEYRPVVYPVLIGGGLPYFASTANQRDLELVATRTFESGVIAPRYRVQR